MKSYVLFLAFLSTNIYAEDAAKLAQKHGCMGCHSVDRKVLGPSYSQIAAKYKDDPGYLSTLVNKVKNGGRGVWGSLPMPPAKTANVEDISTIVNWIVTGVQPSTAPLPSSADVNAEVAQFDAKIDKEMEGIRKASKEYDAAKRNYEDAIRNPPAPQPSTQTSQNRSSGSGKSWNIDEASHCLQVISAVDANRCGRPGGYEFTVKNSCPDTVKYTLQLWKSDGSFTMLNNVNTIRPNSTGVVWSCDLSGQYGKYMSACFEGNWLKTCRPLIDSDYDRNGNLITQ